MRMLTIRWMLAFAGWLASVSVSAGNSLVPPSTAGRLVEHYNMQRVPQEGPWFALTYSSEDRLEGADLPARYGGRSHAAGSAIVVVETPAAFSALHRLQTDEVWHFYGGSPIDMLLLYQDGHGQKITLGSNPLAGEHPQFTVPRGVWQGSAPHGRTSDAYSFAGDQLAPGFEYTDFEMGYRDTLQQEYPAFASDIELLTRIEFAKSPSDSSMKFPRLPPHVLAPLAPVAILARDVPSATVAPGVILQELVGRLALVAKTPTLSVAQFTVAAGRTSATSFNHRSQEVFFVLSGTGNVHLDARVVSVCAGSTVFVPAEVPHSVEADVNSTLMFLAISAPAFSPDDYVALK